MYILKFSYFILIAIFSFFKSTTSEFMCDEYLHVDEYSQFFTIAGYKLPQSKYSRKINESVPCPCSAAQPCLRKCCLGADVFTRSIKKCHQFNHTTNGEGRKFDFENLPDIPVGDYALIYGSFCRSVSRSLEKLKVLEDGSLELQYHHLPLEKYCIEYFEDEKDFRLLECEEPIPETSTSLQKMYTICLAFSISCLIVTLFVYLSIKKLRNLPGKVLLCYVSSLLTTETCLMGLLIFPVYRGTICETAAYLFQFSFSATFFWLNVMCFDLWLAFRRHQFLKQPHGADGNNKKFTIYCLYAWGVPLIISTVTMLIELSIIPGEFVKPEIGQNNCWFKTHEATFWYFYSYTSILLMLNLYMFLTTLSNLLKREKISKIFQKDGNKRHNEQEKQRFFLYLKLFLIMGINWIMDVLSYYMRDFESMKYVWYFTDLTSTLQGFLILLIFVCNRKVLGSLNEKWYPGKKLISQRTKIATKNSYSASTPMSSQRANTQTSVDVEIGDSLQTEPSKTIVK